MPLAEPISAVPPRERTVVEGNIVEHPIWNLSNRQARPKRLMVDAETGKVLVDPRTLKPREYVDPADYTQEFDLGPDPSDGSKRRQLVIKADVHAGFPTVHALRFSSSSPRRRTSPGTRARRSRSPRRRSQGVSASSTPPAPTSTPSTTPWMPSRVSSSSTSMPTTTSEPGPFIPAAAPSVSSRRRSSSSGRDGDLRPRSMAPSRQHRIPRTTSSSEMVSGRA